MDSARNRLGESNPLSEAARDALCAHLDRVMASAAFASSGRSAQLLRYLVTRAMAGQGEQVNEYAIGVDVFERPESFDPRLDSIVRTELSRLRKRLKDYYLSEGAPAEIRIDLPLRSYVPIFVAGDREPATPVFDDPSVSTPIEVRTKSPIAAQPPVHARRWWPAWALGGLVILAGLLAMGTWAVRKPEVTATMAVLPFLNLSGDPGKEYLGDSIADELTETLAESKDLRVVARTSAFQYKNKTDDVREIGRKLNVNAILEGSIQQRGDRYRVIAQLIRTADGYHLWSRTYDTSPLELQQVEAEIARSTGQALLPAKSSVTAGAVTIVNPEAHELYLRSIYQLQLRTPESLRESLALAEKAVQVDPSYVRAYGAIVRVLGSLTPLGLIAPPEAAARARVAFRKALELDPGYSDGHAWAAMDAYVNEWDWPRAEKEFKLALDAPGSHGQADTLYGWSLMTRRRFQEARTHLQIAEDLDPQSPGSRSNMVVDWIFERKFPEAKREIDGIFKLNPKSLGGIRFLGWVSILESDCTAGLSAAQKAAEWYPKLEDPTGQPLVKVICGHPEEARRQLADLERKSATAFVSPYVLAEAYAGLRNTDKAIHYLEKSAEARETQVLYLEIDTLLDGLRGDARFSALERRVGLR